MNRKKLIFLSVAAVMLIPLVGCTPAAGPDTRRPANWGTQIQTTDRRARVSNVQIYSSRPDLAQRVMDSVPGVHTAVVLVRDNTAYVAVNEGTRTGTTTGFDTTTRPPAGGSIQGIGTTGTGFNGTANRPADTGRPLDSTIPAISEDMRIRIVQSVRQADPSLAQVYVSNDRILMNRFQTYIGGVGARTRTGINDLGDVIRRVFPTAR